MPQNSSHLSYSRPALSLKLTTSKEQLLIKSYTVGVSHSNEVALFLVYSYCITSTRSIILSFGILCFIAADCKFLLEEVDPLAKLPWSWWLVRMAAVVGCTCTNSSSKCDWLVKQQLLPSLGVLAWNEIQPCGLVGQCLDSLY